MKASTVVAQLMLPIWLAFSPACRSAPSLVVLDLAAGLNVARRQPSAASFEVAARRLGGADAVAIVTHGQTRLTYHVTLPKHARFRCTIAIDPASSSSDALLFIVGVSDGRTYRSIASNSLAPADASKTIDVSLEEFADLTVDLILNTRSETDALRGTGVWSAPVVVAR